MSRTGLPLLGQPSLPDSLNDRPASRSYWPWATTVFALAGLTVGVFHFREVKPTAPFPVRYRIPYQDGVKPSESALFSLSPDGRTIAYSTASAAGGKIWIQALDSLEPRVLLELKASETLPYWSTDSKSLLYVSEGQMKKADLAGGGAQTLCDAPGTVLGVSSNREQILFGSLANANIMKVAAGGGKPVSVLKPNGDRNIFPFFLPDGKHFLYLRISTALENTGIYIGSLATASGEQPARRLIATSTAAEFVPGQGSTGRILFLRDGNLMSQDFETASLQVQGELVPVARSVGNTRAFPFFASGSGNLVYRNAPTQTSHMTWFDRSGRQILEAGDPLPPNDGPVLSPSGLRAGVSQWDLSDRSNDLWLYTMSPWSSLRLVRGPTLNESPVWSADGRYIAYASRRSSHMDIYKANANGDGQQIPLLESPGNKYPKSWSRNGYLLYVQRAADTENDLWVLPPAGKPFAFLASPANEVDGSFSPDGNWVAYLSDEAGTVELYIRSFTPAASSGATGTETATVGPRIPVSTGGAGAPHWRADGRELYYIARNGNLMAVPVTPGPDLRTDPAVALFPSPLPDHWDAAPDGQRFLFAIPVGQQVIAPFTVVLNWQAELKK